MFLMWYGKKWFVYNSYQVETGSLGRRPMPLRKEVILFGEYGEVRDIQNVFVKGRDWRAFGDSQMVRMSLHYLLMQSFRISTRVATILPRVIKATLIASATPPYSSSYGPTIDRCIKVIMKYRRAWPFPHSVVLDWCIQAKPLIYVWLLVSPR